MSIVGDYKKEIIDTREFVGRLYESRYSEIFEKLDKLYKKIETDFYEKNPFLNTAYRVLHDTGLR